MLKLFHARSLSGFMAVLLIYIWCDEYWLSAYNVPDYCEQCKQIEKLVIFHPQSIIIGIFIPSAAFFKATLNFINWRAFSSTFFFILLISLMWEVTLASPYQWRNYNYSQMIGITIGAWVELPIEAVFVWMAVTFTTVII